MYLYEAPVGEDVSIEVKTNAQKQPISFDVKIAAINARDKAILVAPIRYQGMLVNFSSPSVIIQAVIIVNNKPLIWKGCRIQSYVSGDKKYHAIICSGQGLSLNRRRFFRLKINEKGKVNTGTAVRDALIRDISSQGFCFSLMQNVSDDTRVVTVMYTDSVTGKSLNLKGKVVRSFKDKDGHDTFGCYMSPSAEFEQYMKRRQSRKRTPPR